VEGKKVNTLKSKVIAILVVIIVVVSAYALGTSGILGPRDASASPVLYSQDTVTSVYDKASPAVFEIQVTQQNSGMFGRYSQEGEGSGFLIDNQGNILTNNHVVDGATSVKVIINDSPVDAKVVGTDPIDDLALINVDPAKVTGITPLDLADSSSVKPGQMVIAIGNPYGLEDTVTVGVISGLNRTIGDLSGMLQTDADLNPGNSGGPLLDANGSVVGINTAIESGTSGSTGIGFAVPSNIAKNTLSSLKAGKQVEYPWIGISGATLNQSLTDQLGISVAKGIYVVSVVKDSPADKAGLTGSQVTSNGELSKGGDVITAIDGKTVNSITELSTYVKSKNVGDVVTLSVLRDGSTVNVQVTLGVRPATIQPG
jgi:S1-C subfamily serine protease